MKWYWRVRIYNDWDMYAHVEIATEQDLKEIEAIQNAYKQLTGRVMLIEGMSEESNPRLTTREAGTGFYAIWSGKK